MRVNLSVRFVGVCAFARRSNVMHVLNPPTHHHDQHEARLFLGEIDINGGPQPIASLPLDGAVLRIEDTRPSDGPLPNLPAGLFDLRALFQADVNPDAFGDPGNGVVASRTEVVLGGSLSTEVKVDFEFVDSAGTVVHARNDVATLTTWTTTVDADALLVTITRDGAATRVFPPSSGDIYLDVLHVPIDEMPPNSASSLPRLPFVVKHFPALYTLYAPATKDAIARVTRVHPLAPSEFLGRTRTCPGVVAS
jgi:hypothetical protein